MYAEKSMKSIFIFVVVGVVVVSAAFLFLNNKKAPSNDATPPSITTKQELKTQDFNFENPKKSAHYETNTPSHGAILPTPPINVVIDFNFDLSKPSSIKIEKDGQDFGIGETLIDQNKLTMRRDFEPNAPDGLYTVLYNACWPDKTCHEGNFQFAIDKKKAGSFIDLTNQKEVTINLKNIAFLPKDIKVSKGVKITWVNDDSAQHYINSDSHPAHSYFPAQNSKALKQEESFILTFEKPGIYPYHCSAHANSMSGNILVE